LFDPEFNGLGGAAPFGWNVGDSRIGVAEVRDGALEVYYYGRREGELASQLLLLEPGNYALTIGERSPGARQTAGLSWQVSCAERRQPLYRSVLVGTAGVSAPDPVRFAIPSDGCRAQYLRLMAVPADVVRRQSVAIEFVRIERTGG
jgi:hypothetical protein